jgi:two-component system cell cycle sensor histidine kinase/response regulator CckA
MAELTQRPAGRARRPDVFVMAGAAFFVAAVLAAAYPALRAGPETAGGLMLLLGLAGVAVLGLYAFRQAPPADTAPDLEPLLQALAEPACAIAADGRILFANAAWTAAGAPSGRLARPRGASALFSALRAAGRGETGRCELEWAGRAFGLTATRIDACRLLLRLAAPASAAPATPVSAAQALAAAPAELDTLSAAAPFGAALLDGPDPFAAAILEANPALRAMVPGLAEPGRPFAEVMDPKSRADAQDRVGSARAAAVEVKLAGEPPRMAHLYLSRLGERSLAYLVDVSEQKQLELQLSQAQKMQAIGQLAGGVAHDFNNLLTAIQLRLDELLHRHPVGDPSYEGLAEIRQTGLRAADLVRKLLAFSRKQTVQRETLDLGELISEFEVLLRRLLREDVKLETDYGRNLPFVRADKSQLETAVMNLAVNARDAMRSAGKLTPGEKATGVVRIRTARQTQAEARALGYAAAPEGEYALIEVADTGPGIPPEILSKIFEPFFTTKPVGEGTGLGLATVYGIVKQADGWIAVDSKVGEGTAFRIFLPVHVPAAGAAQSAPPEAPKARPAARDLSGVGRILFVEDEDAVRGVAARLLRARGYEVIEACDGEEALELAEQHAGQIDLLISDVIMPGLDGPTMLKKARKFLGEAPVMFISGYAEAEFSDLLEGETGVTFLPKPLDIKILAEKVKQQLAA